MNSTLCVVDMCRLVLMSSIEIYKHSIFFVVEIVIVCCLKVISDTFLLLNLTRNMDHHYYMLTRTKMTAV